MGQPDMILIQEEIACNPPVYGILIIPFVVEVCALFAFADLPLHSDSRHDGGE